jgi:tRNA pseudouridine38-40 synthase
MIALAPKFEGEHDFSAFAASDDRDIQERSKVRTIHRSTLKDQEDRLIYQVTGSGFLKHMVRNIVGTLLEAGKGNFTAQDLSNAFTNPKGKAGPTAPASGLLLLEVEYPAR